MNPLQRIRRNFASAFTGQVASAVLTLGALAINTRALGADDFGVFIVIQAVSQLTAGVFAFQTWQAMIRFGAEDLAANAPSRLRARFRFGLAMDTTAAIVATVVALGAFSLFGEFFKLTPEHGMLGVVFALSGLTQGTGASVGVLRLTNRFGLVMTLNVVAAGLLLVSAICLAAFDQPLAVYVYATGAISACNSGMLIVAGWLRAEGLARESSRDLEAPPIDRGAFLRYSFATSLSGTLNIFRQRGEVLLVSSLLGATAAGLYGAAYRAASALARFGEAGRQAVFPEIAGLVSKGDKAAAISVVGKTIRASSLVALPAYAVLLLFGGDLLGLAFGAEYEAAYPNLIWLMTSTLLYACTFALGPYIQIVHGSARYLAFDVAAFAAFVLGGAAGPLFLGTLGAGLGAALYSITLVALLFNCAFGHRPTEIRMARSPEVSTVLDGRLK